MDMWDLIKRLWSSIRKKGETSNDLRGSGQIISGSHNIVNQNCSSPACTSQEDSQDIEYKALHIKILKMTEAANGVFAATGTTASGMEVSMTELRDHCADLKKHLVEGSNGCYYFKKGTRAKAEIQKVIETYEKTLSQ